MDDPPERHDVKGAVKLVVVLDGGKAVKERTMTRKYSPHQLQLEVGGNRIFMRNTNLQNTPLNRTGCVIWLPHEGVIAIVIKAIGRRGYVYQLLPPKLPANAAFTVDMDQNGICLEQVCGQQIVNFDNEIRPKKVDNTGCVVPLVDSLGFVKCNVKGPDIGKLPIAHIPDKVASWLGRGTYSMYRGGIAADVPVLYVSKALQVVLKAPDTQEALMSVPFGKPEPASGGSDRLVVQFALPFCFLTLTRLCLLFLRYHYQWFVYIRRATLRELANLKWCDLQTFEASLLKGCVTKQRVLVPKLIGGVLRIKVVDQQEEARLCGTHQFLRTHQYLRERVKYKDRRYIFGYEPKDLSAPNTYGVLVSSWAFDAHLTRLQVSYDTATLAIQVYGSGYASRGGAKTTGSLNVYFRVDGSGRGTPRPHPSASCAWDEVSQQQYFNGQFGNDLMHCEMRRQLHTLAACVYPVAFKLNPQVMELVGTSCSRGILTSGFIPKQGLPCNDHLLRKGPIPHAGVKKRLQQQQAARMKNVTGKRKRKDPTHTHSHTNPYKNAPNFGFANTSHCDMGDRLTEQQIKEWMEHARGKWPYCLWLLENHPDLFCIPSTVGYHFCFKSDQDRTNLQVQAFFSMEGLGLAMQLHHGLAHHFLGATFAHHTSVPLCWNSRTMRMSSTNCDDNCLIIGCGTNGGGREVAQQEGNQHSCISD
jgi:hypothetical protein